MRPDDLAPTTLSAVISSVALGVLVTVCGLAWHGFIYYVSASIYLPWGAVLALAMTFCATVWLCLHTQRTWSAGLMGVTFIALFTYAVFGRAHEGSALATMNTAHPTGVAGTLWGLGSLLVILLGIVVATRLHLRLRHKYSAEL